MGAGWGFEGGDGEEGGGEFRAWGEGVSAPKVQSEK